MAERSGLCALLVLLFFLLATRELLRWGASPRGGRWRPGGSLALVIAGRPPKYALRRVSALLRLCHWPGSVRCYAQGLRSSDSPSVWPLEFLEKSSCHQALLLPWGISLDESWDRHVYQAMRDKAPNALYSFLVRSRNDTRASAPPEIVFPSRKVALVVPDFRFALGAPRAVAQLARGWFPSFFAGLVAYPWPTLPIARQDGLALALDPQVYDEVSFTSADRATLLALGADGTSLDPLIWELLFETPAPYVRLY